MKQYPVITLLASRLLSSNCARIALACALAICSIAGGTLPVSTCSYVGGSDVDCMHFLDQCKRLTYPCAAAHCEAYAAPYGDYCWNCGISGCTCVWWTTISVTKYTGTDTTTWTACNWGTRCNSGECYCQYDSASDQQLLYLCST